MLPKDVSPFMAIRDMRMVPALVGRISYKVILMKYG